MIEGSATQAGGRSSARVLHVVAPVVVLAAVLWTFRDVAWGRLSSQLHAVRPGWIGLAVAVNLGVVCLQAARWLALVRPLAPAATYEQAFKSMVIGFALSMVLPARAGELARARTLGRHTGLPSAAVFGTIVLDYLVNAAGLLLGLAILPFVVPVPAWLRPGVLVALALFVAGVALVLIVLRPGSGRADSSQAPPTHWATKLLASARQGLGATTRPRALGLSLAAALAAWWVEINVAALGMKAVGLDLPFSAAFLVLVGVNLALAVPFGPPGNIGTLEMGATLALLGLGVAKEQALAFGIVYHLLQVVPVGIMGALFAGDIVDEPVGP